MKIWRRTAEYTVFDHTRNEEILVEMEVEPIGEKLRRKKLNWLRHVERMNSNRMPKSCCIRDQMDEDDLEDLRRDY